MLTPLTILQKTFVYLGFRGQQEAIIQHVTSGQNAFVVMPTALGKRGATKTLTAAFATFFQKNQIFPASRNPTLATSPTS